MAVVRSASIVFLLIVGFYEVSNNAFGQSATPPPASSAMASTEPAQSRVVNRILDLNGNTFACSGAGLRAAINVAGPHGVVDARGCDPGPAPFTSTIEIPANVRVYLGPYTWVCGVAGGPCWSLSGSGAKLLGETSTRQETTARLQTGTILRMGAGVTKTTDMVVVNQNPTATVGGVEIGGFTIDFMDTGDPPPESAPNVGRYGLAVYGINRSWIHDIALWDCGSDCFHAETAANVNSYDVIMDRVFARVSAGDGFKWTTAPGSGFADMDRWTINDCNYNGYRAFDSTHRFGTNGFHLVTGSSIVSQSIYDFSFNNIWVGGVQDGGDAWRLDQSSPVPVSHIHISGELEDVYKANSGTAVYFNTSGPNLVGHVTVDVAYYNYASTDNLSDSSVNGYDISYDNQHLHVTDSIQFRPTTLPVSPTSSPVGGQIFPSANGIYEWLLTTDGIIHVVRTDIGPTEEWRFDQGNNRIYPAADNTGSLGTPANRWGVVSTVKLEIASVASLTTTGAASDRVTVSGATSYSHCSLTATNALAAANIATTYISEKAGNHITVSHASRSGMTYDVVCTAD